MDATTILFIALAMMGWCLLGFGLLCILMEAPKPDWMPEWLAIFICGPLSWLVVGVFLVKEKAYNWRDKKIKRL